VTVVDYDVDAGLPWPGDERDESRCPACSLPMKWVQNPSRHLRGYRCVGADRHLQLDRMHRAASALIAAGYDDMAAKVAADIDRLRSPRPQAA